MTRTPIVVNGTTAPGFESVRALYEHNMNTLAERNTQLCIYHNDEKVVDLWSTAVADEAFSADSLVNIFSSGKSLAAIAMASLVSKGLLDYSAKVTAYWPEFGANGKENLTVADILRHEGGMPAFNVTLDPVDLLAENLKQNKIGEVIEAHPLTFRKGEGNAREYHAITRGWILNEIFRRVEPAGRTIGEFLREDISAPLQADAYCGVTEDELTRISPVQTLGLWYQVRQAFTPKFLKRRMELNIFQIIAKIFRIVRGARNSTTAKAPTPFVGMKGIGFFNDRVLSMGETPSANHKSNARSLAKIAAMMSSGGCFEGKEYLSEEAWQAMHGEALQADMAFATTTFTQGGVALYESCEPNDPVLLKAFNEGREGFYGWMGLGGSIFQWHPQHRIGFGYVPTSLNVLDLLNERGKTYQAEVLRCVERLQRNSRDTA